MLVIVCPPTNPIVGRATALPAQYVPEPLYVDIDQRVTTKPNRHRYFIPNLYLIFNNIRKRGFIYSLLAKYCAVKRRRKPGTLVIYGSIFDMPFEFYSRQVVNMHGEHRV